MPLETELATIVDVPIIHAGTFYPHNSDLPFEVSEEDLDEIVEGSTILQPIIREAIDTGIYRGNEELSRQLSKPIPGLINIKHQEPFPSADLSEKFNQWMKDAVKDVSVSFHKKAIDGKNWVVKRFENVRNDVAATLQAQFPFRSSEFIPLTDPNTGRLYPKVERSTAFLDVLTTPAVGGQTPDLVIEFAAKDEPLVTITHTQGVNIMAEKPQNEKAVDVSELQQMRDTLTELQKRVETAEREREKAVELAKQQEAEKDAKIAELQAKQAKIQSEKYIAELSRLRKRDGKTFQISPAYLDIAKSILEKDGIVELAEGQSPQDAMFKLFDEIADMGGNVVVQLSLEGEKSYSQPEQKPDKAAMIQELMEKEGISENAAWIRVTDALNEYKTEV